MATLTCCAPQRKPIKANPHGYPPTKYIIILISHLFAASGGTIVVINGIKTCIQVIGQLHTYFTALKLHFFFIFLLQIILSILLNY